LVAFSFIISTPRKWTGVGIEWVRVMEEARQMV